MQFNFNLIFSSEGWKKFLTQFLLCQENYNKDIEGER
jgi:hypothetical protein